MDHLDTSLFDAWNRVSRRVREQRVEALRRSQRRFRGVLTRPMREWCIVVRASDTRINEFFAIIDPKSAVEQHLEHAVRLDGRLIRRMTRPVMIPWPGVTYHEAARMLGRKYKTIKNWVRNGVFVVNHYREFKFPEGNRRSKNRTGRPYVWTRSPMDPNNFQGRPPHAVWGTLWQSLWEHVPDELEFDVVRAPRFRMHRMEQSFRGWDFICPGRVDANGERQPCGRRCSYLYYPQAVWTIGRMIADMDGGGFDMPEDSGLAGQWFPGLGDPVAAAASGQVMFACKECWQVRSACMANCNGWNEFITQISGGLLYGREVPRPKNICPIERKKRPYTWTKKRGRDKVEAARDAKASG